MKILVTGAAGRLGSSVIAHLANTHEIIAHDVKPRPESLPESVRYEQGDLRDHEQLKAIAKGVETIVHLGAIPGRIREMRQSELYEINVQGTYNVLEAAQHVGARNVVLASSLCAMGLPDSLDNHGLAYLPLDEAYPCRPRHTYDLTKLLNEVTAETFSRTTGVATICLRFPALVDVATCDRFERQMNKQPSPLVLGDYLDMADAVRCIDVAMNNRSVVHDVFFVHAPTIGVLMPTPEHLKRLSPMVDWRGDPPGETTPLIKTDRIREKLGFEAEVTWQAVLT